MQLLVRTEAEADIAAGYRWYERRRVGLGIESVDEVSITIDAIQAEPKRFPVVLRNVRRALVHRFPYGAFFVIADDGSSSWHAMHLARDPRRVHRRARKEKWLPKGLVFLEQYDCGLFQHLDGTQEAAILARRHQTVRH